MTAVGYAERMLSFASPLALASCAHVPAVVVSYGQSVTGDVRLRGLIHFDAGTTWDDAVFAAPCTRAMARVGLENANGGTDDVPLVAVIRHRQDKTDETARSVRTTLTIEIHPRVDRNRHDGTYAVVFAYRPEILWQASAVLSARSGSRFSRQERAAPKLADALFKDFPGESGRTITVP